MFHSYFICFTRLGDQENDLWILRFYMLSFMLFRCMHYYINSYYQFESVTFFGNVISPFFGILIIDCLVEFLFSIRLNYFFRRYHLLVAQTLFFPFRLFQWVNFNTRSIRWCHTRHREKNLSDMSQNLWMYVYCTFQGAEHLHISFIIR